ncbi:MAG: single-stranded-DNA-specific exonuclease RecJ [Rhizobiales bacterium]|nr:single-stranded-DNA-specific exonuclease RecJ [Hyphomicrobiales bacterium]
MTETATLTQSPDSGAGPAERRLFLGVRRSARGLSWYDRLAPGRGALATAIAQRHDVPELLGRLLAARDVGIDEVPGFLDPRLRDLLPDPKGLQDMGRGAERLATAIEKGERVAIFGDYDVDGATSSALLARFLAAHDIRSRIYIPDRLFEGYGPNPEAIASLIDEGAQLIVTVDCGTASHGPLAVARERGVDVVVIDHHQADAELPEVAALINPNRQDDLSGMGHLCAVGVVFLTLVATTKALRERGHYRARPEPSLLGWLDLVALGTVCDVVPLEGLNRAFVVQGLQVMRQRRNLGLRALADAAGLAAAPTPYHLGYVLGPRINAGGRIGNSALGATLLISEDDAESQRIAETLDRLNRERKTMETEILEAARAAGEAQVADDPDRPIIIAGSRDWHKGLVGLVASRLTEQFGRPSLVIAWGENGEGTGSLRSIRGCDIGAAVRQAAAEGVIVKGGGHAMAAGLTVAEARLGALEGFLRARLAGVVRDARAVAGLGVDGALSPGAATPALVTLIEKAGPYGAGNPSPRFVFPAQRVRAVKVVGEAHLRCTLEGGDGSRINAIAFRAAGTAIGDMLQASDGMPVHVAGALKRDTWGGRERIDLTIDDVADPRLQEQG